MARQEHDREDLLREATAYVVRMQLAVEGFAEPVVAGFRSNGCCSLYFGANALHFNTQRQLRRAFWEDRLIKSEAGKLVLMRRERSNNETALSSRALSETEQSAFVTKCDELCQRLAASLAREGYESQGEVPPGGDALQRLGNFLSALPVPLPIADSPRVS